MQVIAQINNLISIKERAGSLGRPTGFLGDLSNCSQIDLPPLPLPLPTPAGASAKDAMASDQSLLGRGTAGAARRPGQVRGGLDRHIAPAYSAACRKVWFRRWQGARLKAALKHDTLSLCTDCIHRVVPRTRRVGGHTRRTIRVASNGQATGVL